MNVNVADTYTSVFPFAVFRFPVLPLPFSIKQLTVSIERTNGERYGKVFLRATVLT